MAAAEPGEHEHARGRRPRPLFDRGDAGVLVNDVVEAANGYVPPSESDEEDALSTFFAGLGFPLRLALRRRCDDGDEAPSEEIVEGEAPSLPEPFLKKCIAELLYTEDGAAVACRIIERAEPRELIYKRCMDVRTATAHAVAVEPGRVQSLASWTPDDEDPTVSRDEAASRVPLADAPLEPEPEAAPPQPEWNEPAAQVESHALQLVCPAPSLKRPASQSLQCVCPSWPWYRPAAQLEQPCQPASVLKWPASHTTQCPALPPPQPVCCMPFAQW